MCGARSGGASTRPRLAVFRANRYIYAQVIDDDAGRTVAAASSQEPALRERTLTTVETAAEVGKLVAVPGEGGRGLLGRLRPGRVPPTTAGVKALADAAREEGLEF